MTLLVDAHCVLWWLDQDHLLSKRTYDALADRQNILLLSTATIWEIAVKHGLGKLSLSKAYRLWIDQAVRDLSAVVLPISIDHAAAYAAFPLRHRDPFDRMLIAQVQVESAAIVSQDAAFDDYGVQRIW